MGDLWETAVTAASGVVVVWLATARGLRWARRRCDEALEAAHRLPPPPERSFVLVARTHPGSVSGARAREVRALQQALAGPPTGAALRPAADPGC